MVCRLASPCGRGLTRLKRILFASAISFSFTVAFSAGCKCKNNIFLRQCKLFLTFTEMSPRHSVMNSGNAMTASWALSLMWIFKAVTFTHSLYVPDNQTSQYIPSLRFVHRGSKKPSHRILLHIFAKYWPIFTTFHCHIQPEISNKVAIKDLATPQMLRYTSSWNTNVRKPRCSVHRSTVLLKNELSRNLTYMAHSNCYDTSKS